jgi:hypothetical protein
MKQVTTVNPLITNFMSPRKPEVVSASEIGIIYDPQKQITFYMGGGKSGSSRSNDGYKGTKEKTNGGYYEHNDAERYTDD